MSVAKLSAEQLQKLDDFAEAWTSLIDAHFGTRFLLAFC